MNTDQTKKTWSNSVTERLELTEPKWEEEHWKKESIFELPTFVKDRESLRHFVKRGGVPIQSYVQGLLKDVHLIRESYARQLDEKWVDDDRFVELMIQDGCFILEFLAAAANYHVLNSSYALSDPMFSYHGTIVNCSSVMRDLLLVENQLPYLLDVRFLQSEGIIVSSLGSDKAVVKVLKEITRDTVLDSICKSYMAVAEMNMYHDESMTKRRRRFRNWHSKLYSINFSNPWSFISVGGSCFSPGTDCDPDHLHGPVILHR
ncbi:hypothetical protein MKX01_033279 [Papaver californicum]|nr:hypothetical protein MKX01_033279 [Papaver californicum]